MRSARFVEWPAVLALVALGLVPASIGSAAHGQRGYVIGNGGVPGAGGGRILLGTVGQPAIGLSTDPARQLCHGFWCFGGSRVVSVDDPPPAADLPLELSLGPPYPNPGPGEVRFALALPSASAVRMRIFDAQGRQVREVVNERLDAGWRSLGWDGRDTFGRPVRSGVFFALLSVENQLVARRRIVLKR